VNPDKFKSQYLPTRFSRSRGGGKSESEPEVSPAGILLLEDGFELLLEDGVFSVLLEGD